MGDGQQVNAAGLVSDEIGLCALSALRRSVPEITQNVTKRVSSKQQWRVIESLAECRLAVSWAIHHDQPHIESFQNSGAVGTRTVIQVGRSKIEYDDAVTSAVLHKAHFVR